LLFKEADLQEGTTSISFSGSTSATLIPSITVLPVKRSMTIAFYSGLIAIRGESGESMTWNLVSNHYLFRVLLGELELAELEIKTERLNVIRKARKIGRPKLAKQLGISERQLAKIETSETAMLTDHAVSRLSQVLQIRSMTLTGEFSVMDADLQPIQKSPCASGCCS